MKSLLISTVLLFVFAPTEKSQEEYVIQAILESDELTEYFSYLPRYQRTGEHYYFLLKNELVKPDWSIFINSQEVKIMNETEMRAKGKYFYMTLESFEINAAEAKVKLHHKYDRLYREEKKSLIITATAKRKENRWEVEHLEVEKRSL